MSTVVMHSVLSVDGYIVHDADGPAEGTRRAWSASGVSYWSPARTDVMRWVLKPSQCIRPE